LEVILFTIVAAGLYVISDSIVKAIEKNKGEILKNRSIIFFAIITVLSLITFNVLQTYGPQMGLLPTPNPAQEITQPAD